MAIVRNYEVQSLIESHEMAEEINNLKFQCVKPFEISGAIQAPIEHNSPIDF